MIHPKKHIIPQSKKTINAKPTNDPELSSFKDLFEFLQNYSDKNILDWLKQPWIGKDKQESVMRLFAYFGLLSKLTDFTMCNGNFNLQTIEPFKSYNEIFYDNNNKLNKLKDSGDSSDLTGINKKNNKNIIVTTSKNINKLNIGKLGISQIFMNAQKYKDKGYIITYAFCVRNIEEFNIMKNSTHNSSTDLLEIIETETTIIIDWNDLNEAFHNFKLYFQNKDLNQILKNDKETFILKMHQQLSVIKTIKLKQIKSKQQKQSNKILWGHVQRSGKSYIIAGTILEDSKDKEKCNYLIITTAPNETITQYLKILSSFQLQYFNVVNLNGKNKKPTLTNKNVIVCSKQFLQTKIDKTNNKTEVISTTSILWLKNMKFDIRFLDESHNGGTTELAKKTLDFYGKKAFTIYITATYTKPTNDYNIPKEDWILWDMEDICLCKNINIEEKKQILIEKHGVEIKNIIELYSLKNIINEYSKYPSLYILTYKIKPDIKNDIISKTTDNNYGWSTEACFLLKQSVEKKKDKNSIEKNVVVEKPEFQNEPANLKLWYDIFGKKDEYDIPDKDFPDDIVFIKRIEKICKNPKTNSRFIGDTNEPMIIMAFLPQNDINLISTATINLLKKNNVLQNYEIISINCKTTTDPIKQIEDTRKKAKINNKNGVLVLSGRQCSLGVSIENCDIVLLLNNTMSFDMISQMMFRSMTEEKGKTGGFVIDMNIHRSIDSLTQYSSLIKPTEHPIQALKYILQEKIIILNGDHWMPCFGYNSSNINSFCNSVYNIYSSKFEKAIKHNLDRLSFKNILLSKVQQHSLNTFSKNIKPTKEQKQIIDNLINNNEIQIKKGIEKTKIENNTETYSNNSNDEEEKDDKKNINYMDILRHIIILTCLLTIHNNKTSFIEMYNFIENNIYIYEIFINQIRSWWGNDIDEKKIKSLITIYIDYTNMNDDKELEQIVRTIKELFIKNINNSNELSLLIDKYLIPQELEKKTNAEVSTPYKLRKEMLSKIPIEFWKKPQKVFEPCSGKGGFLIDIIGLFMEGLIEEIPDEKERYRTIVEDCLYWSEINPTNIFICKLLIDPHNQYKLNFNEGDTLVLDIKEKWSIEGFDAVIGNPPYNSSGNIGTGHTIWQYFTEKALKIWIKTSGLLLYVHPAGWRKPKMENSKYDGLYDLMVKENQMIYLEIHGTKDGIKIFKCGTRYDWYLIEKQIIYKNTIIKDENGKLQNLYLNNWIFIPNYDFDKIYKILALGDIKKCNIIKRMYSYSSIKKNISKEKTEEYKYPCIHSTTKKETRFLYSNINDKGLFGVRKVIFGDSGINNCILDNNGIYGMTEHGIGIQYDNIEEGVNIKKALETKEFKEILNACSWSNYQIDWNLFSYFSNDFWKEFI